MNTVREKQDEGAARPRLLGYVLGGVAVIGVAAVLYVIAAALFKPADGSGDVRALAHGDMAKFAFAAQRHPAPETTFLDADGKPVRIAELRGRLTVVNLWATWCAPCVKEMPTLAALQSAYPGDVRVIAVSMDKAADREKARAFIAEHPPLRFYQDEAYALAFALDPPAEGFPTTVIYDAHAREVGRLSGGADWSSPDARALIGGLLARP